MKYNRKINLLSAMSASQMSQHLAPQRTELKLYRYRYFLNSSGTEVSLSSGGRLTKQTALEAANDLRSAEKESLNLDKRHKDKRSASYKKLSD